MKRGSLSRFSCGTSVLVELEFVKLVFVEGGKPENPDKTLVARQEQQKLNPHMAQGRNRTPATLVGCECSCHCATAASAIV